MAVGDIVTGKLDRSVTAVGSWTNDYRPASGVEAVIFNLMLEVDFPVSSGSAELVGDEEARAEVGLFDGTDTVQLDSLSLSGLSNQADYASKIVITLGTPMKLPVTNSIYLRLDSSLAGGMATGNIRLWYSGIQTK